MELIDTEIVILTAEEGGRVTPLSCSAFNGHYRPHIVIENPEQSISAAQSNPDFVLNLAKSYLGVAFISGPHCDFLPAGEPIQVVMALLYFPKVNYSEVVQHERFTIREGKRIVGFGKILSRWNSDQYQ